MPDLKELIIRLGEGSVTEGCIETECENGFCGKDITSPGIERCYCYDDFIGINCEFQDTWRSTGIEEDSLTNKMDKILVAQYLTGIGFFMVLFILAIAGLVWNRKLNLVVQKLETRLSSSVKVRKNIPYLTQCSKNSSSCPKDIVQDLLPSPANREYRLRSLSGGSMGKLNLV